MQQQFKSVEWTTEGVVTRFRAFQLDSDGSLFSYYKQNRYTLIEARLPKGGIEVLIEDLQHHNKQFIDVLHITSWDNDHCNFDDLSQIILKLRPELIEYPAYEPKSDTARLCKNIILGYDEIHQQYIKNVRSVDFNYIASLPPASAKGTNDIVYHSKYDTENSNDKSLIRLFRSIGFNVLSLGDCECGELAKTLVNHFGFNSEVDILVLPHHGADNGFITAEFLEAVKPKIAVCTSNWGNQYEHPKQTIRNLLTEKGIPLFTTKSGDIMAIQKADQPKFEVHDFTTNNEGKNRVEYYTSKRYE